MPNIMMIIILIIMINDNLTDMVIIRKSCVKSGKVWSPRFLASGHLADERTQALLASDHHDIDQNMRFMIMGKNYDVFKNPAGRAQEAISWGFASLFCFSHRLSKQGSGSWIQYPVLEIAE